LLRYQRATKQRLRRNSRVRSGEWSGGKSRARSRAYSRACSVAATGRVVGRVPSRVILPVSVPVTDRAAPPLAPRSPYVRSGPATSPLIHPIGTWAESYPPVLHNRMPAQVGMEGPARFLAGSCESLGGVAGRRCYSTRSMPLHGMATKGGGDDGNRTRVRGFADRSLNHSGTSPPVISFGCPGSIRTTVNGSKVRCPATRRRGTDRASR
jgi:hypothetical protein